MRNKNKERTKERERERERETYIKAKTNKTTRDSWKKYAE
jgi:hypothetical protein